MPELPTQLFTLGEVVALCLASAGIGVLIGAVLYACCRVSAEAEPGA